MRRPLQVRATPLSESGVGARGRGPLRGCRRPSPGPGRGGRPATLRRATGSVRFEEGFAEGDRFPGLPGQVVPNQVAQNDTHLFSPSSGPRQRAARARAPGGCRRPARTCRSGPRPRRHVALCPRASCSRSVQRRRSLGQGPPHPNATHPSRSCLRRSHFQMRRRPQGLRPRTCMCVLRAHSSADKLKGGQCCPEPRSVPTVHQRSGSVPRRLTPVAHCPAGPSVSVLTED